MVFNFEQQKPGNKIQENFLGFLCVYFGGNLLKIEIKPLGLGFDK